MARLSFITTLISGFCLCALPLCAQETNCGDGIDNDGDGLIDCYDGDCQGVGDCESFFFNPPTPDCGFTPPPLDDIELMLLYMTDEVRYPIDQRAGVFIGDMNGDGIPDLVSRDPRNRLQIFSGDDGRILQSITTPRSHPFGQTALADVDGDGNGDIFHLEYSGVLARYEFGNPNAVWRTGNYVGDDNVVSTAQIADINQDGRPEVYVGDRIFDAITGTRYVDGNNSVNVGGYAAGGNSDRFPIYYDLYAPGDPKPDGSGTFGPEAAGMEYIAGNQVWTVDFTSQVANSGTFQLAAELSASNNERDGLTSIADINGDGRMDVAVMDGGRVYAWDPYTNEQIGTTFNIPNTGSGGRINIGDFDGDGDVELGFAGRNIYIVRDYSGSGGNNNGTWSTLWQKTGLDDGSQRTGSTLFDFDGDGRVEVVYSEEEDLFIYDGATGDELFRTTSRSGTRTEYPLVADVNGDGQAEIIVTAQERNGPQFSGVGWISVYSSANAPWVPARQVWNQHGYNVTNINNDLTVPQFQQDNLNPALGQRYNNFLVQTSIGGDTMAMAVYPAPDAIINPDSINGQPVIDFSGCPDEIVITLIIDNEGDAPLSANTPISYYVGDPRVTAAMLIQSTTLGAQVEAGDQLTIVRTIPVGGVTPGSAIFLSVNDPGFQMADLPFDPNDFPLSGQAECDYTNNVTPIGNVRCGEDCADGIDNDGDGLVDEPNLVQFQDEGCPGETLPAIQTDVSGGTWSVLGGSSFGTTVDQSGVVTLGRPGTAQPVTETIRYDDGICFEDVTVTIRDDEAPTVTCPGDREVNLDAGCSATLANYEDDAQVLDNCSNAGAVITTMQTPPAGSAVGLGPNLITITATDESGNAGTCTFTVTGVDRINPAVTCPPDSDVTVDGNCDYTLPDLTQGVTPTDNCSATGAIDLAQTPVQGTVVNGNGANVLITLVATDEAGNVGNCTYTLTLRDETPPTITCPTVNDQTLSNQANNCTFTLLDYRAQVQRADNCSAFSDITFTQDPAPGTPVTAPGTVTVTLTGTDAAGNASVCTIQQVVVDQDPPQLSCPPRRTVDFDPVNCEATVPDVVPTTTIVDNCGGGGLSVTQDPAPGTTFTGPLQNVTVTATDASGNSDMCVTTIASQDVTPPTISCPADQQLPAGPNCTASLPDYTAAMTADACSPVTVTQQPGPGTTIDGLTMVTLTARDQAGNATTCSFDVDLIDQTPPTITCPGTQIIPVDGTCEVPLPDYTDRASAQDNCDPALGSVSVTQLPAAGTLYDINDSPVTVTLTVTDAAGNTADCNFTVELQDNQPPQISCPVSPQTSVLDANCATVLPDFRPQTTVTSMCMMSGFTLSQSPAPGTTVNGEQTLPVTITAADGQGNTVACTFDFQTLDQTPPSVMCPADRIEPVDGSCDFSIPDYTALATIADNCSSLAPAPAPNLTVVQDPAPGTTVSGDGTVSTIRITATDAAGNSADCEFTLTLEDVTPPTINCPADQNRTLDDQCSYTLEEFSGLSTATDNCTADAMISITQRPAAASISLFEPGSQTVTLTAADMAGNTADCSFLVTLTDVTPPTITCPPARTLAVDDACTTTVPNLVPDAAVSDNCVGNGPLMTTQDIAVGTTLTGDGTTQTVTLTTTDLAGLTASCTVMLTLDDVTPPSVICPAAQDLDLDATGCSVAIPDYATQLTLDDNCTAPGNLTVQQMPAVGTTLMGAGATQTVSFDVNDGNGNSASCSFEITLRDVTDPVVTCPTPPALGLDANCSVALPDYTAQTTATDDCSMGSGIALTQRPAAGSLLTSDGSMLTVTITADDGNGNTSDCSFTVTAEDTVPPMITCPADREESVSAGCDFTIPDYTGEAGKQDNCSAAAAISISQSPVPGTVIPESQLDVPQTITLTAEDAAGNTVDCTFEITPVDDTPPSIVCPQPQTILLDAANCEATVGDYTGLATVLDNCSDPGDITVTQDTAAGTTFTGILLPQFDLTLTATDESGNFANCTTTILIRDEVDPTVDCSAANRTVALDDDCNGVIPDLIPSLVTDDNCSPGALTVIQDPVSQSPYGGDGTMVTVTFTVEDASGNAVTCQSVITFEDQAPPNPVVCPADQDLNVDDNCSVPLPDYTQGATVLDNCRAEEDIMVTQSPMPGTMVAGDGTVIAVVLTADDLNGNTATCTFDVTLRDETALDLTCPGGQLIIASGDNCDGTLGDYTADVLAVNQCMAPATGTTISQSPAPGLLLTMADLDVPQTVTIEAVDPNLNTSTCTFEVVLVDTLAPTLTCPANFTDSATTACDFLVLDYRDITTIEDNCAARVDLTIEQNPLPGSAILGPDATQTVTVTATDPSGNRNQCNFVLTVADFEPPLLDCPPPDTLFVNGTCTATIGDYSNTALITDNCTGMGDIVVVQNPTPGTTISGHLTDREITLIATDASGNVDSCTFTVTTQDTLPPMVFCPGDQVVNPDAQCNAPLPDYRPGTKGTDNCANSGDITFTQRPAPGEVLSGQGTATQVTIVGDDGNGNLDSCTFIVTVEDNVPPEIVCPADRTEDLDADCTYDLADLRAETAVQDNCTPETLIAVSQDIGIGQTFSDDGTQIVVTLTADDGNGNTAQCVTTITLEDNIAPTITCPQPEVLFLDAGCAVGVPDYRGASVADNCTVGSSIAVSQVPAPGFVLTQDGTTQLVTLTADDGNGNTTDCSFTVTARDNTPPTITCPADQEIFLDDQCTVELPDFRSLSTAADNCTTAPATAQSPTPGTDLEAPGVRMITLTTDDGNGNTADCQFMLTVTDTVPPELLCPTLSVIPADANCTIELANYVDSVTVNDNCGPLSVQAGAITVSQTPAVGTPISAQGTLTDVTLTATDANGNVSTCVITVEVTDTIRPTIVCPDPQVQFAENDCTVSLFDYTNQPDIADNCTAQVDLTVTQSPAPGTTLSEFGTIQIVTLTVDDGNGNTSSCDFSVTVDDDDDPTITCPPAQTIEQGNDCDFTLPDYRSLAITDDNCGMGSVDVVQLPAAGTIIQDLGTVREITLTATDVAGNTASCTISVTTVSPTPPPASSTVILAVIEPPTGTGTVDLADAFDPLALTNLTMLDLDQMMDPGSGPFVVSYYTSVANAEAENAPLQNPDVYNPGTNGDAVAVRIEDPTTGCFVVSQILLERRIPGISGLQDTITCSRPQDSLNVDGDPMPGTPGSTIVRHEWRVIDSGDTRITQDDLINDDEQVVTIIDGEARSGSLILEYQFFEDPGSGPIVPSVPKRIRVEIRRIGAGDFFWDGMD